MSENKNDHVIVAVFDTKYAAEQAVEALQSLDRIRDEIELGAIGMIGMENGKVKVHSGRSTGKGAKAGAVVGLIAGVLSGGMTIFAGLLGGSVLGGVMGSFFKKSLHLTKEEINQIGAELTGERVAVVVTLDEHEIAETSAELERCGGKVRTYAVPSEALAEAVEAAQQDTAAEETAAQPDAGEDAAGAAETPPASETTPS